MPTPKLLGIADHLPISDFIRRVIGAQTTIRELRQRLRCHKCGQRGALIEVLQLPR
jgi:hypothetical protein